MNSKVLTGVMALGFAMLLVHSSGLAYFNDTENLTGTITAAEADKSCKYLGKIEIINGNDFTIDSGDGNDRIIDDENNIFLLVEGDEEIGDNSMIQLEGTEFKDGEVTSFYFEVISDGVYICKVGWFGGLDNDSITYESCMDSDWIETNLANPGGKQAGISHIDFWYCDWSWNP